MFKKTILTSGIIAALSMNFIACGEEEVPPPPPKVSKPKAKEASKFKKLESLKETNNSATDATNAKSTPSSVTDLASSNAVQPGSRGSYVLQVGISPSKAQAIKLRDKLKAEGYKYTYLALVENPGELEGTFYRVRLGNFKTIPDARIFGSQTLKPMGISFWIDNKSNDQIGNPAQTEQSDTDDDSEYYSDATSELEEQVPEETQAPPEEPVVEKIKETIKEESVQKAASKASDEDWDMPSEKANEATQKPQEVTNDWDDDGWN